MKLRTGSSLVEMMVATIVVAIFAGSLFGALIGTTNFAARAEERTLALNLAKNSIETVRTEARDGNIVAGSVVTVVTDPATAVRFTITRQIVKSDIGSEDDFFHVKSDVTWVSSTGPADRLKLQLWICDDYD